MVEMNKIKCDNYNKQNNPPWCLEMKEIAVDFQDIIAIKAINAVYTKQYKAYLRKAIDISNKNNSPCKKCTLNYLIGNFEANISDLSCDTNAIKENEDYIKNDHDPKDKEVEVLFKSLSENQIS